MWQPGSLTFDPDRAAVVLNDADDIIVAEGIWKFVTLAGGDTVRVPDTENGNLFAAAPELLETLEALMEFWDNGHPVHAGALLVNETREIIAKAKGETT